MALEKQEPLPFEAASEKPAQKFIKEKSCPMCGFDLGDNPGNCRACQSEVLKKKKRRI